MVTNTMTINKIVDLFKDWSIAKAPFINDFGFGPLWDFGTSRQMKYPCMWVDLETSSNINILNRQLIPEFNFIVMFLDKENIQDNVENTNGMRSNNVGHIMSDTFQLGQDFISDLILSHAGTGFTLINSVIPNKIYDETTDKVYGWAFSFTMRTSVINCKDSSIVPPSTCSPAIYKNSDNTFEQLINSGQTFTSEDINIMVADGTLQFPSNKNINLSEYIKVQTLPSGIYTPKNVVSGPFDLLWNQTAFSTTSDGKIERGNDAPAWTSCGNFLIPHNGDFDLQFSIPNNISAQEFVMCGLSYVVIPPFGAYEYYRSLNFAFYRNEPYVNIIEVSEGRANTFVGANLVEVYTIKRVGMKIQYWIDNLMIREVNIQNTGPMSFDSSILFPGKIIDNIKVIIP